MKVARNVANNYCNYYRGLGVGPPYGYSKKYRESYIKPWGIDLIPLGVGRVCNSP